MYRNNSLIKQTQLLPLDDEEEALSKAQPLV